MADQDQLALLRKGVEQWNTWRRQHPTIYPDLSKANLSGASLSGADLYEADLNEADLSGALQLHLFGESLPEGAFGEELFSL